LTACNFEKTKTVLVVEDSEVIRDVITLLLEAEGYAVLSTDRGVDALALARNEQPDAVTLDLALAQSDGREILRRLKTDPATASIPIVVVSAFADALTAPERWFADDVIAKPFDVEELLGRLDALLSR
jgi:DNA-binding response OmpR family regulator